jgi:hypothetical protein
MGVGGADPLPPPDPIGFLALQSHCYTLHSTVFHRSAFRQDSLVCPSNPSMEGLLAPCTPNPKATCSLGQPQRPTLDRDPGPVVNQSIM